jgi:hypothetical protein
MSLVDVVHQLKEREPFDGMDWGAKWRNARAEAQERERERDGRRT